MLFKTLLLSSCAIVVMASSYSASAMINDDDDNDQVPAAPAANPNTQNVQGEDQTLKNNINFLMTAPDLVINHTVSQMDTATMNSLYKAVEGGIAEIERLNKLSAAWNEQENPPKPDSNNQDTLARLEKIKSHLEMVILKKIDKEVIPADLQAQDDTQSKRIRKEIQNRIKSDIEKSMNASTTKGQKQDIVDLWQVYESAPLKVKTYLESLPADTQTINFPHQHYLRSLLVIPDLSRFTRLAILTFQNSPLVSLHPLRSLTTLETLVVNNAQLNSFEGIEGNTNIMWLEANNNPITSLEELRGLANLKVLKLNNTRVTSLEPLKDMKNLKELWINNATNLDDSEGIIEILQERGCKIYKDNTPPKSQKNLLTDPD